MLGVHLANDIVEMIERRALVIGVTKSRFAAMVFEHWRAANYPAISTVDSTARAMVLQRMKEEAEGFISESEAHEAKTSGSRTKAPKPTKKKAA